MRKKTFLQSIFTVLFFLSCEPTFSLEENFLLIDGKSSRILIEQGVNLDKRRTPCSTFKIALSLMGFDSGILENQKSPVWLYQEVYDDFLEAWKMPQTPCTWMKYSCVWYSQLLANKLGDKRFKDYLSKLKYGNQDISKGVDKAWLCSTLKISPQEQVKFLHKMLKGQHPISLYAIQMTKKLLLIEELPFGWKLYGKTGWGTNLRQFEEVSQIGWFIGWIEKENLFYPFAYNVLDDKIDPSKSVSRVKRLILEANTYGLKLGD